MRESEKPSLTLRVMILEAKCVWHAQTNGMGVVFALTTPFAALRDVPHTDFRLE